MSQHGSWSKNVKERRVRRGDEGGGKSEFYHFYILRKRFVIPGEPTMNFKTVRVPLHYRDGETPYSNSS